MTFTYHYDDGIRYDIPDRVYNRAKQHNIAPQVVNVLYSVLLYWNSNDERAARQLPSRLVIGEDYPPTVQQLLGVDEELVESTYTHAIDRLHDKDFCDERYIARTQVPYAINSRGRQVIGTLCPDIRIWQAEREGAEGPLAGDPNELLGHRFAVAAIDRQLDLNPVEKHYYPTDHSHFPDLVLDIGSGGFRFRHATFAFEVFQGNNDYKRQARKFHYFGEESDRYTIWITPNSTVAAKLLNIIDDRLEEADVPNAPFSNPVHQSIGRLRDYVSREDAQLPGLDDILTVPTLLDTDVRLNVV